MKYIRAALKLAAETALISTVGSFFWMALGKQVVQTYASGAWEQAGGVATFWTFFVGIVQLYLLYRLIQWVIGFIARKTAKKVDGSLKDLRGYGEVRDRMVNIFDDRPRESSTAESPESSTSTTPSPGGRRSVSYFRDRQD